MNEPSPIRARLLADDVIEALTLHLQSEWAGPYMARVNDFTDEELEAGELRKADAEAHEMAKAEARRGVEAMLAALIPDEQDIERAAKALARRYGEEVGFADWLGIARTVASALEPPGMSLTDEQCAEIAAWSRNIAATGPAPRIIVSRWHKPGEPERTPMALYAHPEDYLALERWADRQMRFDLSPLSLNREPGVTDASIPPEAQ